MVNHRGCAASPEVFELTGPEPIRPVQFHGISEEAAADVSKGREVDEVEALCQQFAKMNLGGKQQEFRHTKQGHAKPTSKPQRRPQKEHKEDHIPRTDKSNEGKSSARNSAKSTPRFGQNSESAEARQTRKEKERAEARRHTERAYARYQALLTEQGKKPCVCECVCGLAVKTHCSCPKARAASTMPSSTAGVLTTLN